MAFDQLERIVRRRRFKPYTVELDNGTHIPIEHPESIIVMFDVFVGIRTPDGKAYVIDPESISAVRFDGNGQRRRRR